MNRYFEPKVIQRLVSKMRYLNLDFDNDKQIYTNYTLLETIPIEDNQSKEDCDEEEEEKKPKV